MKLLNENSVTIEVSEVKLIYKTKVKSSERLKLHPHLILTKYYQCWNKNTIEHVEEFKVIFLNRSNLLLGIANLSVGGTIGSLVDVKVILQYAIKVNASGIIVSHNYPSGNSNPSESDIVLTRKIKEAVRLLDLNLLDHLIISPIEGYFSFADDGVV
jgi:DNA repair protein RadC